MLPEADLVLVKGFHFETPTKVELLSDRNDESLCEKDGNLLAFVTAIARPAAVPAFQPDSIKPPADLIEREILARS